MPATRTHRAGVVLLVACGVSCSGVAGAQSSTSFRPRPPSPFAAAKARALIRDRLPCLGCHRLDGDGGRIGPDLSSLPDTTSAAFVYSMIRDPQGTLPGSGMPRTPLSQEMLELVASYVVTQLPPAGRSARVAVPARAAAPAAALRDAKAVYAKFCAACHGERGRGDGYNAPFLPVPPAAHADREAMGRRSDDRLFDAVAAGGYVVNGSNRMPAFGLTLSAGEIRGLVRYIRELCGCQGPAWSRTAGAAP